MSLFFDYKIKVGEADLDEEVLCTKWCPNEPVLAVSTTMGHIYFYQEEGEPLPNPPIQRKSDAVVLQWSPKGKILASGWKCGTIALWSITDGPKRENQSIHRSEISMIQWSPAGHRLVTADENGVYAIFKTDQHGQLTLLSTQNRKQGAIRHCVFCLPPSSQNPGEFGRGELQQMTSSFFLGGDKGVVTFATDMGHNADVQQLRDSIDAMELYAERNRLIIITKSYLMIQLSIDEEGHVSSASKFKLSIAGENGLRSVLWAGPGLLAAATGEAMVRFWDLANDENFFLSLGALSSQGVKKSDKVICIAFNPEKRMLSAGTKDGKIIMWHCLAAAVTSKENMSAKSWEALAPQTLEKPVTQLEWGPGPNLLSASLQGFGLSIMNDTTLHKKLSDNFACIQTAIDRITIEDIREESVVLKTGIRVKGLDVSGNMVVVWNGKRAEVYECLPNEMPRQISTFPTKARYIEILSNGSVDNSLIYRAVGNKIEVCNMQGVVKKNYSFSETEGAVELLDINNRFMAAATSNGVIKVFKLRSVKPEVIGSGRFEETPPAPAQPEKRSRGQNHVTPPPAKLIGSIRSIRCNSDGTKVSILSDRNHHNVNVPDTKLYVYNMDMDVVLSYEFGPVRYPTSHFWDSQEPKLMAVESLCVKGTETSSTVSKVQPNRKEESKTAEVDDDQIDVTTLFVTQDYGIQMQDCFSSDSRMDCLLGIRVPHLYFFVSPSSAENGRTLLIHREGAGPGKNFSSVGRTPILKNRVMRDFVGLEKVDDETRKALLDFSYNLTVGNMDEAYKAVKLIKNPSVWENMAQMCVKTKRLDVAEVCLGNMGHARGAAAVRVAKKEPELDACIAMVAVQLGLMDDAVRLYKECGRYDLLNRLFQAAGLWERAIDVAKQHDRIHLRTTFYNYAKYLEEHGQIPEAVKNYEKANAHRREVPRIYFGEHRVDELEDYVMRSEDSQLLRWWAQFSESNQEFDKAKRFYEKAGDFFNLVRILCYNQEFEEAQSIVQKTNDKASAYHLARQHEAIARQHDSITSIQSAIQLYEKANQYNHAIRLSKEFGLDAELMQFALHSNDELKIDCANYFEQKRDFSKAVQLYQKGGDIPKALDICFKGQLFEVLRNIADDLGETTNPGVLRQCATFFIENEQYEKGAHLLVTAKDFDHALKICLEHKVKITEEMAEKMTPEKNTDPVLAKQRIEQLTKLAQALKRQGSYHLATKKYTQAGEKLKAMKCLLKSGDTEKIIFFAQVSRNREIYIFAANYLQNLDWHNEPEVMKAIIQFYTKAKAFEQLSGFYEACAQVEIDEYRDYDKALGALKEAVKFLIKARVQDKEEVLAQLQQRIYLVDKFVEARRLVKTDPAEMVKICQQLLDQPDIEVAIRVGDGFALLIEYYYSENNYEQAYKFIEQMKRRNIILNPYLDASIVEDIHRHMGITPEKADDDDIVEDDDDIQEDIDEYRK